MRVSPDVNALNILFMSNFATHLYESHADIFARGSELGKSFDRLLTYILKGRTSGHPAKATSLRTRVFVECLVSVEYWGLQQCASEIINRSHEPFDLK